MVAQEQPVYLVVHHVVRVTTVRVGLLHVLRVMQVATLHPACMDPVFPVPKDITKVAKDRRRVSNVEQVSIPPCVLIFISPYFGYCTNDSSLLLLLLLLLSMTARHLPTLHGPIFLLYL